MSVCPLCPHHCSLAEGQIGACHARICRDGVVTAANYGRLTSIALDPIEKKPLSTFHPGAKILSIGSYGCNLHCPWCQNDSISQVGEDSRWEYWEPAEVVAVAERLRNRGNIGVAYTYNEPLISYEYLLDCCELVHEAGMVNVLVSNGCICDEPLQKLLPLIDAANIDLKGPDQAFYDRCGGNYEAVWNCIRSLSAEGCHVEVTTLVIPGLNDSDEAIASIAQRLATLDPQPVYHLSRFFPCCKMSDASPTPKSTMRHLATIARTYLPDVRLGNM
ncbi:MAG: AmmeMemoRadiSam system radical SAM enzyme [Coriobacteriales bacterium]|nr:AmmeMemoRadiSam system radical SAM enzyme [Coriobacteriales bacterium]